MYHFLRRIIKISLFFFFKRIVITGKEYIPSKGPLIIVANHPNTLMDPLIIASLVPQRIGFIAKSGIFSNRFLSRIFSYLHIIPIYRKKDVLPGEKIDNTNTFIKCHEYLTQGRTFLILPEGNSYYELRLRKIKTGTARIALSFEELKNFDGNLKILPVALDYSDSIQFRSTVSVIVNPAISVINYKETYLNDNLEAVLALTEDIRKELAKNVPNTSCKDQEDFLIKAHKFYASYAVQDVNFKSKPKEYLSLRHKISKALNFFKENHSNQYEDLKIKVFLFFQMLKKDRLTLGFFTNQFLHKNLSRIIIGYCLKFILLSPFYIFGLMANYLPYILPYKIFKALKIDIEYKTSVQMIIGMITFPLFYSLELWLLRFFIGKDVWLIIPLLFIFLITGYITMYYWAEIKRFTRIVKFHFFMKPEKKLEILKLRNEILKSMIKAQESLDLS